MNALAENNKDDVIEKGPDIKETWDNIHMDEEYKRELDSENICRNITSNNVDTIDINDREFKKKDESEFDTSEKACKFETLLHGDIASSNRKDQDCITRTRRKVD